MTFDMIQRQLSNKFIFGFLQSGINRWIIFGSCTIVTVLIFWLNRSQSLLVFPGNNNFTIEFFDDSNDGGKSQIIATETTDTTIGVSYIIRAGFLNPYVGINLEPENHKTFSIKHFNQLEFEIESQEQKNMAVYIIAQISNSINTSETKDICLFGSFEISSERKTYTLPLKKMAVPGWWYDMNQLTPEKKILPELEQIIRINFFATSTPPAETERSLRIHSIVFTKDNRNLQFLLILSEILLLATLLIIHSLKNNSRKKSENLTITYKPVNAEHENKQASGFLEFINANFHESTLSLEAVSDTTGISQRRIANTIAEKFGCNFKTYLNRLRINESKRLLSDSELNMGEIAFKVGFNNQTHFNRVFKSIVGQSPSEYKEQAG